MCVNLCVYFSINVLVVGIMCAHVCLCLFEFVCVYVCVCVSWFMSQESRNRFSLKHFYLLFSSLMTKQIEIFVNSF